MTTIEDVLIEIRAELARLAPIYEGLTDYAWLDITPDTRAKVAEAMTIYQRRIGALTAAQTALDALLADGYPALTIPPVPQDVYQDLSTNRDTIAAALEQFRIAEASTLAIAWAAETPTS